jgi:PPOX class probable F420-dependent enzyme
MDIATALDFARRTHDGVLTTIRRDGRPQLSNITFGVTADGVIEISIAAGRAKYANLRRDARASLHVTTPAFDAYVVIDGQAEVLPLAADGGDSTVEALIAQYRNIAGEHPDWDDYRAAMVRDRRTLVRLHPTHAYGMI